MKHHSGAPKQSFLKRAKNFVFKPLVSRRERPAGAAPDAAAPGPVKQPRGAPGPAPDHNGHVAMSRRMSRIGTMRRQEIIDNLERASSGEDDRGKRAPTIEGRLDTLGMSSVEMVGDGNCQFRSLSFQLYGTQEKYQLVRKNVVSHMNSHSDWFGIFFEGPREFRSYMANMARDRTWGDELTLRAAVEYYGCNAHVITSNKENWYLVYKHEGEPTTKEFEGKAIFLCYLSPVHYNSIISAS